MRALRTLALIGLVASPAHAQMVGPAAGSGGGSTSPGGSDGQIQYNNSGSFGGAVTGTGVLTALGVAADASGGVALVNGAQTVGNCLKWSTTGVQDAGTTCGGGGGGGTSLLGSTAATLTGNNQTVFQGGTTSPGTTLGSTHSWTGVSVIGGYYSFNALPQLTTGQLAFGVSSDSGAVNLVAYDWAQKNFNGDLICTNLHSFAIPTALECSQIYIDNGISSTSSATVTTSKPILDLSQTWNAGAVTFTGLKANFTDTASASGSLLLDLQVGGTSKFKIDKAGNLSTPGDLYAGAGNFYVASAGSGYAIFNLSGFLGWTASGSASSLSVSADVRLYRDAANILALRNGGNAQTNRTYVTWTDASNGAWVETVAASGTSYLRPNANGTGTKPLLVYVSGSTTVASLPAAATAGAGARAFVTDATATTFLSTVAGSGSNKVPVVSDGTNWLIGG